MRLRRSDAAVMERAYIVGRRLRERLQAGLSDADLRDAAASAPLEAVLVAMALDPGVAVARRLAVYLERLRHVRLEIDGGDLRAMGYPQSPRIGRVLHSLLRLKLNGLLEGGRPAELDAAARMRG
jgi:tRNA nucleotidyltransferase (CCA-adding enzyme)